MANAAWRCVHPSGDVKYADRPDHVNKLEARGYVCTLDPDYVFDEHDNTIYDHDSE